MRDHTRLLEQPGREGERITFEYHEGDWVAVSGFVPDSELPEQYRRRP